MDEFECPTCGEPLDDLQCHHHNTHEDTETYVDASYTICDDCPAWWPIVTAEED